MSEMERVGIESFKKQFCNWRGRNETVSLRIGVDLKPRAHNVMFYIRMMDEVEGQDRHIPRDKRD